MSHSWYAKKAIKVGSTGIGVCLIEGVDRVVEIDRIASCYKLISHSDVVQNLSASIHKGS